MKQNYIDRAMRARDPRFAKIADRLGYLAPPVPRQVRDPLDKAGDESTRAAGATKAQRAKEYEALTGEEPDGRWSKDTLERELEQARYGRRDMRAED